MRSFLVSKSNCISSEILCVDGLEKSEKNVPLRVKRGFVDYKILGLATEHMQLVVDINKKLYFSG